MLQTVVLGWLLLPPILGALFDNQIITTDGFSARNVRRNKDQHRYCAKWALEGQCINNHKYMWTSCINACIQYAKDSDELCEEWATEGECTYNPGYVQLYCPQSCKTGIAWSPWLRRQVGLDPLPHVNTGVAAGSGGLQLYAPSGTTTEEPPADMLEAASQLHVKLKVYMHGGHQDLKGFSSDAPDEFLGMLGLTETCLYVLRMYQAILDNLDGYGGTSNTNTAESFTESETNGMTVSFSELNRERVDKILSAVKESEFQADILTRSLSIWVGFADEAGEYIRKQLNGGVGTSTGAEQADAVVADTGGGYSMGMYQMIGLYKGREVAVSLDPPITDESREVRRRVEERHLAKEAAARRKDEERLRRLAELEAQTRAKEQQWLEKERRAAQLREQEAENARVSELLRLAEIAERAEAVERARINQKVAGRTTATASVTSASSGDVPTSFASAVRVEQTNSDSSPPIIATAAKTKEREKPQSSSSEFKPVEDVSATVPVASVRASEPKSNSKTEPVLKTEPDIKSEADVKTEPDIKVAEVKKPSVLHMRDPEVHKSEKIKNPTVDGAANANADGGTSVIPEDKTEVGPAPSSTSHVHAAIDVPSIDSDPLPSDDSSGGSEGSTAGDVDATMRALLLEGMRAGGISLDMHTDSPTNDADTDADTAVGDGADIDVGDGADSVEPDHAQGLPEDAEVEDWIQEVLKHASHGDTVSGSYDMHSGYDAFADADGFGEPHIDGMDEGDGGARYSSEEVGHDPFRTEQVEYDGMFADEDSDAYVPRRRRSGGGRKTQASPTVVLSNGVVMPMIGFGTWQITGQECEEAVKDAVVAGYRHIDTAQAYQNELEIGKAISDLVREGTVKRNELFIATKLSNEQFGGYLLTKQLIHDQMTALNVSYIDLYMLHSPFSENNLVLQYDSWRALEDLYFEGRIHAIGVSNFDTKALKSLLNGARVAPMVVQNKFDIYHLGKQLDADGDDIMSFTRSIGALMVAYSPFSAYPFVLSPLEDPIVKYISHRRTKEAEARGFQRRGAVTPAQVILRWTLQQGVAVIPRTTSRQHMSDNLHAGKVYPSLSADDMRLLSSVQHFVSTPLSIAVN